LGQPEHFFQLPLDGRPGTLCNNCLLLHSVFGSSGGVTHLEPREHSDGRHFSIIGAGSLLVGPDVGRLSVIRLFD